MTLYRGNEYDRIRCSFSRQGLIGVNAEVMETVSRQKVGSLPSTKDILKIPEGFIGLLAPPEVRTNDVLIDISPQILPEYPALFNASNILQVPSLLSTVFDIDPVIFFETCIVHYIEVTKDLYPLSRPKHYYLVALQNNNNPKFQIRAYGNREVEFYNFLAPDTVEIKGSQAKPPFKVNIYDKYAKITDNRTNESSLKHHPKWPEIERYFDDSLRYEVQSKKHDSTRDLFNLSPDKPPYLKDILASTANPTLDSFRAFRSNQKHLVLDECPPEDLTPMWKLATPTIDKIIVESNFDPQLTTNELRAIIGVNNYRLEQKVLQRLGNLKTLGSKQPVLTILVEFEALLVNGSSFDVTGIL